MIVIERPDEARRIKIKKWVLVYGRRKTGKTFIVQNFVKHDDYFFARRDGSIAYKDNTILYETFMEILKRSLSEDRTVVVDEFHRLGENFFDSLHYFANQNVDGKVILISSTLFLSKRLISGKSPLLGLFSEVPVSIVDLKNSLDALKKFKLDKKSLLEFAIFFREPIAVGYFDEKSDARKVLVDIVYGSAKTIPALIGEIFTEEGINLSGVYEVILRAVANGNVVSGEISRFLFARKIIGKDDPSIIQQYLNNLIQFGILKRIEIYGKKKFVYKHVSPLVKLFYYADEKYNISERKLNEKEIARIIDVVLPHIVEDNIREFFSEKFGLQESVVEASDFDVDACLLKFKKPEIVIEVKWKSKIKKEDITNAEKNLSMFKARKILFVQDKKGLVSDELEILDVLDI